MKLLHKTSIYYLMFLVPVLVIGGSVLFIFLRQEMAGFETEDLIQAIMLEVGVVFLFLLGGVFFINRWINGRLWKPFRQTLDTLGQYDLEKQGVLNLDDAPIDEFNHLNRNLEKMSRRISSAYEEQKQFIENASHEMQTPLAVIRTKTDLLLQSEKIGEEEMEIAQSILNVSSHLSQLNKSLLLLSKIENNQFPPDATLDVSLHLEKCLSQFEDIIAMKHIRVEKNYHSPFAIAIHGALADILINNLIQNALQHNTEGGKISITVNSGLLEIRNSGRPLKTSPETLFRRFAKDEAAGETTGLGLAIVRQICIKNNLKATYAFKDDMHVLSIRRMIQN